MVRNLKTEPRICTDPFAHRLVVITGTTSGIGYATAKKFASQGADLLLINRNEQKSIELCENLKNEFNIQCDFILADFSRLTDIHTAAEKLASLTRPINVLIHNAGIYNTSRIFTENQLEAVFQTNYLSTFILNYTLKEKLKEQAEGRIIFVNSEAYRFMVNGLNLDDLSWKNHGYSGIMSYGSAKLAQLLSMYGFVEYFKNTQVTINAMHPGNVKTNSGQTNGRIYKLFKKYVLDRNTQPVEFAAEALYYLGVSNNVNHLTGKFFNLTTEEQSAPPALDRSAAQKLWQISLKLGGFHVE